MTPIVVGENPVCRNSGMELKHAVETGGDWLTGTMPIEGAPGALFRRQTEIFSLAKIGPGPTLRAELPCSKNGMQNDFGVLDHILYEALGRLQESGEADTDSCFDPPHFEAVLTEFRDSCPWEYSADATGLILQIPTDHFKQKVHMEAQPKGVRLWTELGLFSEPDPVSRCAFNHFLLVLNAHLRLVRASLLPDTVVLEVALGGLVLNCRLVEKAVEGLMVGARFARRECSVLLNPKVAQTYCAFHQLFTDGGDL